LIAGPLISLRARRSHYRATTLRPELPTRRQRLSQLASNAGGRHDRRGKSGEASRMDSGREEFRAYWLPLVAAFIGITLGVMSIPFYFLGPMIKPLEAAFGWSRVELLSASSLMAIGITLVSPVAGWLADRYEARLLVALSLLMLGGCYVAAAMMTELWHFQLIYFLTGFLGGIGGATAITRAIGSRFIHARGLAIGIVLSGTGVASFAAPLFVHALVEAGGWQSVWWALAGLSVLVAMPIAWVGLGTAKAVPGSAAKTKERPVYGVTLREATRDPRFYILLITILLFGLPISSTILNLVPMLQDLGADPGRAAAIAAILGITILLGRLLIGLLLDRIRARLHAWRRDRPDVVHDPALFRHPRLWHHLRADVRYLHPYFDRRPGRWRNADRDSWV
jgi:MFS family permease